MEFLKTMLKYFFDITPGQNCKFYIPLIILAIVLTLSGLIFSFIYKKYKKENIAFKHLFKKLSSQLVLMGTLFLLLIAVRYENIPYFAMRIWIYLCFLYILFLTYKYIKKLKVDYPREKYNIEHHRNTKEENRYLPNKR